MIDFSQDAAVGTILLIGASKGPGLAMAGELAKRQWHVVATVRGTARTKLHDLADEHGGRIEIETVDITQPDQIAALHDRLSGRSFDILFVNAGTANMKDETVADISADEFARVLVTNALSPMRVIEDLADLVRANGLIGVMSSGQGSITDNTSGRHEVYRSSKSALNQLMRSYAARHCDEARALLLMAPGWIRTDLGGPMAPIGVEESIPKVLDVIIGQQGKPGLQYLDRDGNTVHW
ncbi:SDR family oxidoreductase [Rhizobium calliandrae]|uniref:SDR family oxidoreductase n=1 Tax=Rhizobium calliandrae TaxID=1312182 RepID=A0ABT7KSR3_9HYPH|nr:SDR family oxidoreductase [Rhizobium calliandrae]MDL2410599.1 SDR family oxidoreductase [Rhizobium calliandrae]